MVSLDFFVTIDLHTNKTKALYKNLSIILHNLVINIISDDFF